MTEAERAEAVEAMAIAAYRDEMKNPDATFEGEPQDMISYWHDQSAAQLDALLAARFVVKKETGNG
jgi:hypothetical protein